MMALLMAVGVVALFVGAAALSYRALWHGRRAEGRPGPRTRERVRLAVLEGLSTCALTLLLPLGVVSEAIPRGVASGRAVLLLHGYLHNRSGWVYLRCALRRQGVGPLYGVNLGPPFADMETLAHRVAVAVEALRAAGAAEVHIVAHSMGGLVARAYVSHHRGRARIGRLITLGTPHAGTRRARFSLGPNGHAMRPGSPFLIALDAATGPHDLERMTALWSPDDNMIVPAESAALPAPAVSARLDGLGHNMFLFSPSVARLVASRLRAPAPEGA